MAMPGHGLCCLLRVTHMRSVHIRSHHVNRGSNRGLEFTTHLCMPAERTRTVNVCPWNINRHANRLYAYAAVCWAYMYTTTASTSVLQLWRMKGKHRLVEWPFRIRGCACVNCSTLQCCSVQFCSCVTTSRNGSSTRLDATRRDYCADCHVEMLNEDDEQTSPLLRRRADQGVRCR